MCPDPNAPRPATRIAAFVMTCALGVVAPASAQRLAYGVSGPDSSAFGIVDLATGTSTPATADEAQIGAVFTSDGQYAVRAVTSGVLSIRHMPSGQLTTVASDFSPWLAHPRRHTLFGLSGGVPARFDERGLVRWDVCGAAPSSGPRLDLTRDGRALFVLCQGDLIGLDTETGVERSRLVAVGVGGLFAVNADATEIIGWRNTGVPAELVRISLATGQVLATRSVSGVEFGAGVTPTPGRTRMVAMACRLLSVNVACIPRIIDAVSLADIRVLPTGGPIAFGVHVSPDGRDAFVAGSDYMPGATFATWIDVDTGHVVASSAAYSPFYLSVDYVPVPLPPAAPVAVVAGNTVNLSWTLPDASPMVTGYRVDAGTGPGLGNLGTFSVGAAGAFSASGVPPGRYYVRIRAVNYNGVSAPSNEVVIDVP